MTDHGRQAERGRERDHRRQDGKGHRRPAGRLNPIHVRSTGEIRGMTTRGGRRTTGVMMTKTTEGLMTDRQQA